MNDAILITFTDLKRLFFRHQRKMIKTALLCAGATFLLLLMREPKYIAEASFRQATLKGDDVQGLKGLFKNLQIGGEESEAIPLMFSRRLLSSVVEELGLQIRAESQGIAMRLASRVGSNLAHEFGFVSLKEPSFVFRKVHFTGEVPEKYGLRFFENGQCELLDKKGESLGFGEVGSVMGSQEFSFVLHKTPQNVVFGKSYPFKVMPIEEATKKLVRFLEIKPSKLSQRLLNLTFQHENRTVSMDVLNKLMETYQRYLGAENDEMVAEQLAFLEKRQEMLTGQLHQDMREYASYLKKSLRESGAMGLSSHIELTAVPMENSYVERLSEIALEKQRFQQKEKTSSHSPLQLASSRAPTLREYQGVDKESASLLYARYNEELESLHLRLSQLFHLMQELGAPEFDVSSMSGFLSDSVSQDLIRKASESELLLRDDANRSEKEQERIKETLLLQKRFLQQHLHEMAELEKLRAGVLKDKIGSLRAAAIDLLQNEENQILDQLKIFREQLSSFPDKWLLENELKFKKELNMNVIDAMTQFTETKVVQRLLFQVESKPLDQAYAPIKAKWPGLFLFSFAAGAVALCVLLSFHLFRAYQVDLK